MTRAKMAGLIRGGNKVPQGAYATDTDANRQDGVDATHLAKMQRGYDSTYAFARDAINADTRKHGAPNVFITGDELALNAESFIALLADLTILAGGGGPLTNNNGVTFVQELTDDESPLYEETIANFVAASSQYLSLPTQGTLEVGTGSFMAAIPFKTSTSGTTQTLFSYGQDGSFIGWQLLLFQDKLWLRICDGTNSAQIQEAIPLQWQDGKVHTAIVVIDRTANIAYILCDGKFLASGSISAVTGTLTGTSVNFYAGARKASGGGISEFFDGRLGPFKLAKALDYNLIKPWLMIEREATVSGSFSAPTNDSAKRLNNKFTLPATANSYTKCVREFEDGVYDIIALAERQASGGTLQIYLDDNLVLSKDTSGSAGSNIPYTASNIKIGAGKHVIKVKNTVAQTIPLQWIKFMKSSGQEFWNGGATDILLLGDQFKRYNNPLTLTVNTGAYYNNDVLQTASPALNDYMEMDIYLSPGLYYYSYHYPQTANKGKITLKIGDVIVFQDFQCNGSTTNNSVKSGWVRLKGGKQTIRVQITVDGASSKFEIAFSALRLVKKDLVRGQGNQSILAFDQDGQINNNVFTYSIATTDRFNGVFFNNGGANSDVCLFNRYFAKSGTYRIRAILDKGSSAPKLDIGIDASTNNLFSQIDLYSASPPHNNIYETLVSTTRGYHAIQFTANGKNASSGGYFFGVTALQFELVHEHTVVGESGLEEDGKLQLLAKYTAQIAESTITFNISDLFTSGKYSKIIIEIHGQPTASTAFVQMQLNGGSTNYYEDASEIGGGVQTLIDINAASEFKLISSAMLGGATSSYYAKAEFNIDNNLDSRIIGLLHSMTEFPFVKQGQLTVVQGTTSVSSITIKTAASTWVIGTSIYIHGVRK